MTTLLAMLLVGSFATAALAADPAAIAHDGTGVAQAPGSWLEAALFYAIAGVTVVSALGVCFSQNIVRMAVWLFVALGGVAMLYFLLAATFLAAIQLIVYAGGTLILLVFGVMLTSKSPWVRYETPRLEWAAAVAVCGVLLVSLCTVLSRVNWHEVSTDQPAVSVGDIGHRLLTAYVVPFEAAGVLLMIVMVGAAHLARQEKKKRGSS